MLGQHNKTRKRTRIDPILIVIVFVLLLKATIELFFVGVLSGVSENVFWVLITLALTIYFFSKKNYIYFSIVLLILVIGSINL